MAGLYIHVPFCHSKCAYCDFLSRPCGHDDERYLTYARRVVAEYRSRRAEIAEPFRTMYFGGGTPSILPIHVLEYIVEGIGVPAETLEEVTIEANPEDVTPRWVDAIRSLGFNRVSMGAQSMMDKELALIGRRHTGATVCDAVANLRSGGIENISIDLIYGLPTQTMDSWRTSLDVVAGGLRPPHLSCYLLSYEPGTRLSAMLQAGRIAPQDEALVARMYDFMIEFTAIRGYEHYEISNFAHPGRRAVHNSNYWDGTPYLGLGPGAHSFDGTTRRANVADIRTLAYTTEIEEESATDRLNDYIITSLRTCEGLSLERLPEAEANALMHRATRYIESGRLKQTAGRLIIPEKHLLVSDAIMRDLMID